MAMVALGSVLWLEFIVTYLLQYRDYDDGSIFICVVGTAKRQTNAAYVDSFCSVSAF